MKRTILACLLVTALTGCTEDDALVPDPNLVTDIERCASVLRVKA